MCALLTGSRQTASPPAPRSRFLHLRIPTSAPQLHSRGGSRAAAAHWQAPSSRHPDVAVSPYAGAAGRVAYQPLPDGDTIAFGRGTLRVAHVPGHTLGSTALIADEGLVLTGDFLFVQSVGRPDLAGQKESWAKLLWHSLERARQSWPGDLLVMPAHYASELERRADRAIEIGRASCRERV